MGSHRRVITIDAYWREKWGIKMTNPKEIAPCIDCNHCVKTRVAGLLYTDCKHPDLVNEEADGRGIPYDMRKRVPKWCPFFKYHMW